MIEWIICADCQMWGYFEHILILPDFSFAYSEETSILCVADVEGFIRTILFELFFEKIQEKVIRIVDTEHFRRT